MFSNQLHSEVSGTRAIRQFGIEDVTDTLCTKFWQSQGGMVGEHKERKILNETNTLVQE